MILAAVLLKLGTYGFVRIAHPDPARGRGRAGPRGSALLAVIGIIYGALGCLAQTDMKRLIAFSSVAHMGFVMLGIATLTDFGINAAVFGMVAHGLITGMLFFLAGSVKERYHTLEIKRLGGLLVQAPRMGWILGFCAMASLGLPGLAGFWGEFPAILSAYEPGARARRRDCSGCSWWSPPSAPCSPPATCSGCYQRTAFGTPTDEFADDDIHDVHVPEWIAWTPMLVLIVVLGIFPNLVFRVTDGAVTSVAQSIASRGRLTRCSAVARPGRAGRRSSGPTSTGTRSRPRSSSSARSCVVLRRRPVLPEDRKGVLPSLAGIGLLGALDPGAHAGRRRRRPRRCSAAPTWSTTSPSCSRRCSSSPATSRCCCRPTTSPRATTAEGEYYFLLLSSVLGMIVMASARDLITIFVALEMLSIPAYLLAGWRKRDRKGNEAGVKYYLMGVFASACMLYGMSLLYGVTGHDAARRHRRAALATRRVGAAHHRWRSCSCIVGFAFKVSAVPFHTWAPDTYEGAPTPVTAFLSVSSKAAGFVALLQLVVIGFAGQTDVVRPLLWVLAALLDDRRQPGRPAPDEHRAHAGVLVDRPGRLHPRAARGGRRQRRRSRRVERGRHLPAHLRGDEPRRLRRGHRRGPQDAVSAEISTLRRAVQLRARRWPC